VSKVVGSATHARISPFTREYVALPPKVGGAPGNKKPINFAGAV